jgi:hypothetical protein
VSVQIVRPSLAHQHVDGGGHGDAKGHASDLERRRASLGRKGEGILSDHGHAVPSRLTPHALATRERSDLGDNHPKVDADRQCPRLPAAGGGHDRDAVREVAEAQSGDDGGDAAKSASAVQLGSISFALASAMALSRPRSPPLAREGAPHKQMSSPVWVMTNVVSG